MEWRWKFSMKPFYIHSLESWLESQILEAHNAETYSRNGESTDFDDGVFAGREEAFKEVLDKIRNGRVNQRPHINNNH